MIQHETMCVSLLCRLEQGCPTSKQLGTAKQLHGSHVLDTTPPLPPSPLLVHHTPALAPTEPHGHLVITLPPPPPTASCTWPQAHLQLSRPCSASLPAPWKAGIRIGSLKMPAAVAAGMMWGTCSWTGAQMPQVNPSAYGHQLNTPGLEYFKCVISLLYSTGKCVFYI